MKKLSLLMKKLSLLFVGLFVAANVFSQQAEIKFDKDVHDFGTIAEEIGSVSCDFTFINTGNTPLELKDVRPSCGCTTPKWSREPIAPGGKGVITATYSTTGRPGSFSKSITVTSNAKGNGSSILYIRGAVTPKGQQSQANFQSSTNEYTTVNGLSLSKNRVAFTPKLGATETQVIEMENKGTTPLTISLSKLPKYITAASTVASLPPGGKAILVVTCDASKVTKIGNYSGQFYVQLNDGKNTTNNKVAVAMDVKK